MIRTIIVEDEDIIRRGLIKQIPWSELGFTIVGEANNGRDAYEMLLGERPDLLITDIQMPIMDGLSLIEKIVSVLPDLITVIISGHDEFKYAQQALKFGTYDYLLKPINLDVVQELLLRIKDVCESRAVRKKEIENLLSIRDMAKEGELQAILRDFLLGRSGPERIGALTGGKGYCCAYVVQLDNFAVHTRNMDYIAAAELDAKLDVALERLNEEPGLHLVNTTLGERVICVFCEDESGAKERLARFESRLAFRNTGSPTVLMFAGGVHEGIDGLMHSHLEARSNAEMRILPGDGRAAGFAEVNGQKPGTGIIEFDDAKLISMLKSNDEAGIRSELDRVRAILKESTIRSRLQLMMVMSCICYRVLRLVGEAGGSIDEALIDPNEYVDRVLHSPSADGMVNELEVLSIKVAHYLAERNSGRFAAVIARAKEYIARSFSSEQLSMENIAHYACVSSSYLSIIFKRETGETFIEYLTRVRMEYAARLLRETSLLTYEIAEKCGYGNPTYFSTIFKKFYGATPSDFRQRKSAL